MALRLDISLSGRLPRLPSYSKPNPSLPFASISMPSRSARRCVAGLEVELKKSWNRYRINCTAEGEGTTKSGDVKDKSVSVILLAGGVGKRMGAGTPKQYLPLLGQPIVYYSLQTFSQMKEVKEIVVVSDPDYRAIFEDARPVMEEVELKYALPGKERQDSVFSGFQEIDGSSELVCIHDSARPLISPYYIRKTLQDASLHGAAVLGVPVKSTIKEANKDSFVVRTFDRRTLWEMQTPQVIKPDLLRAGFELVNREGIQVTDDVSIVELLNQPVYITEGPYINIKITTPEDLLLAEKMMDEALEEARSKQLYQTYKQVPHFE